MDYVFKETETFDLLAFKKMDRHLNNGDSVLIDGKSYRVTHWSYDVNHSATICYLSEKTLSLIPDDL